MVWQNAVDKTGLVVFNTQDAGPRLEGRELLKKAKAKAIRMHKFTSRLREIRFAEGDWIEAYSGPTPFKEKGSMAQKLAKAAVKRKTPREISHLHITAEQQAKLNDLGSQYLIDRDRIKTKHERGQLSTDEANLQLRGEYEKHKVRRAGVLGGSEERVFGKPKKGVGYGDIEAFRSATIQNETKAGTNRSTQYHERRKQLEALRDTELSHAREHPLQYLQTMRAETRKGKRVKDREKLAKLPTRPQSDPFATPEAIAKQNLDYQKKVYQNAFSTVHTRHNRRMKSLGHELYPHSEMVGARHNVRLAMAGSVAAGNPKLEKFLGRTSWPVSKDDPTSGLGTRAILQAHGEALAKEGGVHEVPKRTSLLKIKHAPSKETEPQPSNVVPMTEGGKAPTVEDLVSKPLKSGKKAKPLTLVPAAKSDQEEFERFIGTTRKKLGTETESRIKEIEHGGREDLRKSLESKASENLKAMGHGPEEIRNRSYRAIHHKQSGILGSAAPLEGEDLRHASALIGIEPKVASAIRTQHDRLGSYYGSTPGRREVASAILSKGDIFKEVQHGAGKPPVPTGIGKLIHTYPNISKLGKGAAIVGAGVGAGYAINKYLNRRKRETQFASKEEDDGQQFFKGRKWKPEALPRRWEEIQTKGRRGGRLLRDLTQKVRGEQLTDARGRPRTPEWKKPWVASAIVGGIVLPLAVSRGKLIKTPQWKRMVTSKIGGRESSILKTKVFNPHARKDLSQISLTGTRQEGSQRYGYPLGSLKRLPASIHRTVRGAKREIKKGWMNYSATVKAKQAAKDVAATQAAKASEARSEYDRIKDITNPNRLSSKLRLIRFAEYIPDWDVRDKRGRSARIYAPGHQKRERRQKRWYERKENQGLLIGAGAPLLAVGGWKLHDVLSRHGNGAGTGDPPDPPSIWKRGVQVSSAKRATKAVGEAAPTKIAAKEIEHIAEWVPHRRYLSVQPGNAIRFSALDNIRQKLGGGQGQDQEQPERTGAIHDVVTGAVEGGLAYPASEFAYRKLIGKGTPSTLKKIAVGGVVGGLATGLVGIGVANILRAKKKAQARQGQQEMRSRLKLVQFERRNQVVPQRTLVAKQRYSQQIKQQDIDTANRHYIHSALIGGALGLAFRKNPTRYSKAVLTGGALGVGAQALTRAYGTRKEQQSPFGERTWEQKRVEKAPEVIGAGVLGAKLLGKERLKSLLRYSSKLKEVRFDSQDHAGLIAGGAGTAGFLHGGFYRGRKVKEGEDLTGKRVIRSHSAFPFLQHEGIGVGPDRVIDVYHVPSMHKHGVVRSTSAEEFSKGERLTVMGKVKPAAARLAESNIGKRRPYSLLRKNCQLFSDECRGAAKLTRNIVPRQLRTAFKGGAIAAGGAYILSKAGEKHEFASRDEPPRHNLARRTAEVAGAGIAAIGAPFLPGVGQFARITGRELAHRAQAKLATAPLIRSVIKAPKTDPNKWGKFVHDYVEGSQKILNTGLHGKIIGKTLQSAITNPQGFARRRIANKLGMDEWGLKHFAKFRSGHLQALEHWGNEYKDLIQRRAVPHSRGGVMKPGSKPEHFIKSLANYREGRIATESAIKDAIENRGMSHIEAFRHVTQKSTDPRVHSYMEAMAKSKLGAATHYQQLGLISPGLIAAGGGVSAGGYALRKDKDQR